MEPALIALLADDLAAALATRSDGARRVLLWLDPERQFSRLAEHLAGPLEARGLRLLRYAPDAGLGQLGLKLALLRAEPGGAALVVYLPGFNRAALEPRADGRTPELWGVYEYRYKGVIWNIDNQPRPGSVPEPPTLAGWLRAHGLRVDNRTLPGLVKDGPDALLARYADRMRAIPPAEWPRPLRRTDIIETLGGDPREGLRELLHAPTNALRAWGEERELALDRLRDEYGLSLPTADGAEELAEAVTIELALSEAWDALGQPADFPYDSRLPAKPEQRARQARFLRDDVLTNTSLRPLYHARITRLEGRYPLADWAAARPGQPSGLPALARERWRRFLAAFQTATQGGWRQGVEFLIEHEQQIEAGVGSPWDGPGGGSAWQVVARLTELAQRARAATAAARELTQANDFVRRYAADWWRIDDGYLRLRAETAQQHGLERVRWQADLAYFSYLSDVNERFSAAVETGGAWPPAGCPPVSVLQGRLWEPATARRAVIICDCLRWDVAQRLAEALAGAPTVTPLASTLPSATPFGMTALLPLGDAPLTIQFATAGAPVIRQGAGPDLAQRAGRKQFLEQHVAAQPGGAIAFIDLDELLRAGAVPDAPLVVAFDTTIDQQGHVGADQLAGSIDKLVRNLQRAIELCHAAGAREVHVVTDHGFLLAPPEELDALGRPELPAIQAQYKSHRYAVLRPDIASDELIVFSPPLAPDSGRLGFPRGVRTLIKAEAFAHGGISLQECVIPHLVSRGSVIEQARVGLDLQVTTERLTTGTVPVILRPRAPTGQLQLGGAQPLRLRLWVETAGDDPPRRVAESDELELRADVDELRPPLYLAEGLQLRAGQLLLLRAIDAETGQELARVSLELLVDWD